MCGSKFLVICLVKINLHIYCHVSGPIKPDILSHMTGSMKPLFLSHVSGSDPDISLLFMSNYTFLVLFHVDIKLHSLIIYCNTPYFRMPFIAYLNSR